MQFSLDQSAALQLDDEYECMQILQRYCYSGTEKTLGPVPEALDWFVKRDGFDAQQLAPLGKVYTYVTEHLTLEKQQLCRWFAPLAGITDHSAAELVRQAAAQPREKPAERLSVLLGMVNNELVEEESTKGMDQGAFLDRLAGLDIPDESKWRLTDCSLHLDEYQQEVQAILEQAVSLFREKKPLLTPLLEHFGRPVLALLADGGLESLLQEVGLRCTDAVQAQLTFSAMGFNSLSNHYDAQPGQPERLQMHYGLLIHQLQQCKRNAGSQDAMLLTRLRAVADKNRLKILLSLREKSLCGQELAAVLQLSPATVSHHINELMQAGMLEMEKRGNSLYYHLQQQGVEALLEQLRDRLC